MSLLYRVLGLVAAINSSMGRFSINFIPLNFGLMLLGGVMGFFLLSSAYEGLTGQQAPQPINLHELFKGEIPESTWVEVEGELHNELVVQYGPLEKGSDKLKSVEKAWSPLIDWQTGTGVMVSLDDINPSDDVALKKITGMVRSLDSAMHEELIKTDHKIGPVSIQSRLMIAEGEQPGGGMNHWLGWFFGFTITGGTLALITLTLTGNTVFKKEARATSERLLSGPAPTLTRITGRFLLPEKKKAKRFNAVPGIVTVGEDGKVYMVANVDASSRFMGITTSSAQGYWYISGAPHEIQEVQAGTMFWAGRAHPSIRFTINGAKTIISYESREERQAAISALTQQGLSALHGV